MAAPSSSPDVVPWWSQFPARAALGALRSVPRIPLTTLEQLFPGIDELEITMRHSGRDRALVELHRQGYRIHRIVGVRLAMLRVP
jgi:hypothetical protein